MRDLLKNLLRTTKSWRRARRRRRPSNPELDKLKLEIVSRGRVTEIKVFEDPRSQFMEEISRSSMIEARVPRKGIHVVWKILFAIVAINIMAAFFFVSSIEVTDHRRVSYGGTESTIDHGPIGYRRVDHFYRYLFARTPHRMERHIFPLEKTYPHGVIIKGPVALSKTKRFELHGECRVFMPSHSEYGQGTIEYDYGNAHFDYETDFLLSHIESPDELRERFNPDGESPKGEWIEDRF